MSSPSSSSSLPSYPLKAHLPFGPDTGGGDFDLSEPNLQLIQISHQSDDAIFAQARVVPSLSILTEAVFGRLTGCHPAHAKEWANQLVVTNGQQEEDLLLQQLSNYKTTLRGPCGYVFQRGDIAWNCRTCQTDPTCVICDECFRNSDHSGHEVYFHRTSPGGCCDCGDAEAWKLQGCCDKHRPPYTEIPQTNDPMEAVKMANKGLAQGIEHLDSLPPRLIANLAVVIGAAVNTIIDAVNGAAIGADAVQWKRKWADEAAKIVNRAPHPHDYYRNNNNNITSIQDFIKENPHPLPNNYFYTLRLHNDDVHTFDEVIDALHEPRSRRSHEDTSPSLVDFRDRATEKTHQVDAQGQVDVKTYTTQTAAMQGFQRLKARGLHASVVSSAQIDIEQRARHLATWLTEIAAAHPGVAAIVVHALVQVTQDHDMNGLRVWPTARCIPIWAKNSDAFPPNQISSYLTYEEAELLHGMALSINREAFIEITGADPDFYSKVPYRLSPDRYTKSPHALWGTLPALYTDLVPDTSKHPLLQRLATGELSPSAKLVPNSLTESVYIVDTDLRKQQEADRITSCVYPHKLPGLYMISGIGSIRTFGPMRPPMPSAMDLRHLLNTSSFRAPASSLLTLLLLDPYPTKQLRSVIHALFLSLLTDQRFKCRFAGALAVAYRPISTLFCAGVGTEADTPLHFTVQILTTGSLVRALGSATAVEKLLLSDEPDFRVPDSSIGVFTTPIAHTIVRCIHTNLLGATKEVGMILNNTNAGNDESSQVDQQNPNDPLLPALTYVAGEHPLMTLLSGAPDDGFLDSRSTRHKRLPQILRDLEYVVETPGTALRLLLPAQFPVYEGPQLSFRGEEVLAFATAYARLLRLGQGMDPQKRKISGGHVEYEQNRWLEAFGLSLNFAGTQDALADSPSSGALEDLSPAEAREALGNLVVALLRELKMWLYKEGMLETGLPMPAGGTNDMAQAESLQRSTLHVYSGDESSNTGVALSCATGIKMTEAQLSTIENALRAESAAREGQLSRGFSFVGPVMADWLRVPHAPLGGDSLSFHLPIHRTIAKCVRSLCSMVVSDEYRMSAPHAWWQLPVLDDQGNSTEVSRLLVHPLVPLIKATIRSSNCRVVWNSGPDCSPAEAQQRRSRSRAVSANIAVVKIMHSLADHPARCLAASQQIERHLWARNGTSVAGMAINYSSSPLCRSFRDLDLLMVQLSAAGMNLGLGARRVFNMLLSRFSMLGYLCDPERRNQTSGSIPSSSPWVHPPRLQDPDYPIALAECFFSTLCVLVTELPSPPPTSSDDDTSLRASIKRELVHALAAEPRSRSEALIAAQMAVIRKEDSDGRTASSATGVFRKAFSDILDEISAQKASSRASAAPSLYELQPEYCEEYDPTFFHLRRNEHQHAMDVIARLRKLKYPKDSTEVHCAPLVAGIPKAHPRFLPCRLLLHLPALDAAIRRALLHATTNGSWLPPPDPNVSEKANDASDSSMDYQVTSSTGGGVKMTTFRRGLGQSQDVGSSGNEASSSSFSVKTIQSSSVSFIEVLQLLTLQIHTLEECASLHRTIPTLDEESVSLSQGLSINSYLRRLIEVPESLQDVWAFKPFPDGPIPSKGSGRNRASILGFLITLYEHRADHGASSGGDGGEYGQNDEGHGGARSLSSSGLKWILRFVHCLVSGASSVSMAHTSASTGNKIVLAKESPQTWTIDHELRSLIVGMLDGLQDLWPTETAEATPDPSSAKKKEKGKAAQLKMMERMRQKQMNFAKTLGNTAAQSEESKSTEADLCIICRCDDADGENNGPIGYLGHVQRARNASLRASLERMEGEKNPELTNLFRVVGHMGCQLRETEAMDSKAVACLPKGSIVTVLETKVTDKYDILSRRVKVRHTSVDAETGEEIVNEGWASVQSSQGYIILSPLLSLCYTNSRWGSTRPCLRQCGHAAHVDCVQKHTLSLHQRAAGEQPYDGRFAANIKEGEFLCPLCKQLCNILVPRELLEHPSSLPDVTGNASTNSFLPAYQSVIALSEGNDKKKRIQAILQFGESLHNAMGVPWDTFSSNRKKLRQSWHSAIQKWDFVDGADEHGDTLVGDCLHLLRQQHISWSSIGYSASAAESSTRAREEKMPFGVFPTTSDPWADYGTKTQFDHPMLLELKRTLVGSSGLLQCLLLEMSEVFNVEATVKGESVLSYCLRDILRGSCYAVKNPEGQDSVLWSQITALVASMPCHVSRDGMLSHRSEARATAAAMWTVKGFGANEGSQDDPPAPLVMRRMFKTAGDRSLPSNWGSMKPFQENNSPFRPFVASSFLYTPILSWDLNTLTGALFSTWLANPTALLPSAREILHLSRTLIVGRLIQAMISPDGILYRDPEDIDIDVSWDPSEMEYEGTALTKLSMHIKAMIDSRCLDSQCSLKEASLTGVAPHSALLSAGQSILPFCRSLTLVLRAFLAAVVDRKKAANLSFESNEESELLTSLILDDEAMSQEDGFYFLLKVGGPKPSQIVESEEWFNLVNRWVVSIIVYEMHHGTVGPEYLKAQIEGSSVSNTKQEETPIRKPSQMRRPGGAKKEAGIVEDVLMQDNDVDYIADDDAFFDASDDEFIGDVDMGEAEEMIAQEGIVDFSRQISRASEQEGEDFVHSSDGSDSDSDADVKSSDRRFANVSKNPIISYQPTFLGLYDVGPGRQGASLELNASGTPMSDLSHLGMIHTPCTSIFTLIRLPKSFVELYNLVSKVKGREDTPGHDEADDSSHSETAICLLTGTVMRSGSSRRSGYARTLRPPGACTLHARKYGSGIGVFFLLQKCTVLLMHNNKSAYSPSLYVDEHGEEDPGLRRGRPLYLNEDRYRALETLWRQHGVPREVAQIRSTSDRVIRDNWY